MSEGYSPWLYSVCANIKVTSQNVSANIATQVMRHYRCLKNDIRKVLSRTNI